MFAVIPNNLWWDQMPVDCASLGLLPEGGSALQRFSMNGFGDTLFPGHECIDADVKSL